MAAITRERIAIWVLLLGLGQVADLLTTEAAMARGATEANSVAAGILSIGGLDLLWLVKCVLVVAMAAAVLMVRTRWPRAGSLVWRGLQFSVVVLAVTALHNLSVIGLLPGV